MPRQTIEIGHTYAPDMLVPQASYDGKEWTFSDTPKAQQLRLIAEQIGTDAVRVAFIDDVIPRDRQRKSQDSWRWQLFLNRSYASVQAGTEAEVIRYESEFIPRGRELIDEIRGMTLPSGYRLSEDGNKLNVGSGKERERIPLTGFRDIDDASHPSCQILDLAWMEYRLTLAEDAVTVLPQGYEKQQRHVQMLASLFPHLQNKTMQTVYV